MRWFCRERSQIQRQSRMRAAVPPGRREDWGNCGSKPAFQEISRLSRRVTVCAWGCPHRCGMGMVFPVVIGNKGGWGVARWLLSPRVSLPSGSCPILVSHVPAWSPVASPSPVSPVPIPVPHVQLLISHPSVLSQWLLSHPSAPCPILCPILSSPVLLSPCAPSWCLLSPLGIPCPILMSHHSTSCPFPVSHVPVPCSQSRYLMSPLSSSCPLPVSAPGGSCSISVSHPSSSCPILVSPVPSQCPVSHVLVPHVPCQFLVFHPSVPCPIPVPHVPSWCPQSHSSVLCPTPMSPVPSVPPPCSCPCSQPTYSHSFPTHSCSHSHLPQLSFLPIPAPTPTIPTLIPFSFPLIPSLSCPLPLSFPLIPTHSLSHPCPFPV
ncbi:BCL-6 corepressor-like protein 1 isoform X1 [Corvus hawaiiensis]|uniref:BCL-6 corepressor-like protein 1 isoform X1 n=1 Tax=Corvus hawaiiensis TaxID=134902 RepID=UPI00201868B6|nr:BCL-6 corepressor-like protein 1 isoform X1 [Corvus hawaiiensis]